jgi:predicted Holliday junction resolvase-like endonuclease
MDNENIVISFWIVIGVILIAFLFWLLPTYSVWQQGMQGQAELKRADFNRQVKVVEAEANLQAQKFNAEAEVARAEGVSKANNIIKNSITELYVKYLWVHTLDSTSNQIIYVPLGSDGLPITEAGRAVK